MVTQRFRWQVFVPVLVGLLLLMAIVVVCFYQHQSRHLDATVSQRLAMIEKSLHSELDADAAVLAALIGFVEKNPTLQRLYLAGDRDGLLKATSPLLHEFREKQRVTHFYFTDPKRVCFLRVHEPKRHGDLITRFTTAEAARTGQSCHGIELGPLGTFTLRCVYPWKVGGRLIGYIELGEEVDQLLPRLRMLTATQLIVTVDKTRLKKADWETGMEMLGRDSCWDRFRNFVVVDSTLPHTSPSIDAMLCTPCAEHEGRVFAASLDGTLYRGGLLTLVDASGSDMGDLAALIDVTQDTRSFDKALMVAIAATLAVFCFVSWFYWVYLGGQQRILNTNIGELVLAKFKAERTGVRSGILSQAIGDLPTGILITDAAGIISHSDAGISNMSGYTIGDLVGKHIHVLQSDVYSPKFFEPIQDRVIHGKIWHGNICFRKRNGSVLWANTMFAPVCDEHGHMSHVVAVIIGH